MSGAALLLALVPASWLPPNHYPPWVSAWQEGLAIALLAMAALFSWRLRASISRPWAAAAGVAVASIVWQAATGRIHFGGDALMATFYVGLFVLAMAVGTSLARPANTPIEPGRHIGADAPSWLALGTLCAASLSVGIALIQWTDIAFARMWIADLPPDGRPFSNLGQANHFCTACFLGIAALGVLREGGRIGSAGFWAGATFMLLGMVMSGSRTAWVQLGIAALMCAAYARRTGLRLRAVHAIGLVLLGLAVQVSWSPLDQALARHVDRPLEEKLSAGARPALWREMITAAAQEPLGGYGWQQIGAAQQRVALDRPPQAAFFEHFDRAHNLVLDLLLWAGIPVGAAILALGAWALVSQMRRITDPRAVWIMTGAFGLLAHAMLEFPLEFAYFLIPFGALLGMSAAMSRPGPSFALPRWTLPVAGGGAAVLLLLIAMDYLRAEENFRMLRMESARIGTTRVVSEVPELPLLNQVEAFLQLVRTEPKPGMTPAQLELMHKVTQRYGVAPALFRYALALGLNGRPDEAAQTLRLLCHIHSRKRCREAREAWPEFQQRHEALRAVPAP